MVGAADDLGERWTMTLTPEGPEVSATRAYSERPALVFTACRHPVRPEQGSTKRLKGPREEAHVRGGHRPKTLCGNCYIPERCPRRESPKCRGMTQRGLGSHGWTGRTFESKTCVLVWRPSPRAGSRWVPERKTLWGDGRLRLLSGSRHRGAKCIPRRYPR